MIAYDGDRSALAVLPGGDLHAPLATCTRVEPGETIPLRFPLRTMHGTNGHDVVVRFASIAGSCDPNEINLGPFDIGADIEAKTAFTAAPLNGKREASIWANVQIGELTLASQELALRIDAHSRLTATATDDGTVTTIALTNSGTAPAETTLELYGTGDLVSEDMPLTPERPGLYQTGSFRILPNDAVTIAVMGGTVDHLIATATDGERTSLSPRRSHALQSLLLDATLAFESVPDTGVRRGDTFTGSLMITNDNAEAIDELYITFPAAGNADLLWDSIALDNTRPIAADVTKGDEGGTQLRVGRVGGGARVTLGFEHRVVVDDPRELDGLRIEARLSGRGITELVLVGDVAIDRRPAFASSTTYLGQIDVFGDRFAINAVITNAEPRRIDRLRVRFDLIQATPDECAIAHFDGTGETRELPLRPTAMHERAGTFVDIGSLDAGDRVTVRLPLHPVRGMEDHTVMKVRAMLTADDAFLLIGEQQRRVAGNVDLQGSSLIRADERPLRLAMPIEAHLEIRNTGNAPARDIRIAIDLPNHIGASLPEAPSGVRWRPFLELLQPGASVATTVTFFLLAPPPAPTARIPVYLDAEGQSGFTLATLNFATPTDPLIDPPRLQSEARDDGYIAMLARVANYGDGTARGVTVSVSDGAAIVLRTTTVDDAPVADRGARSALDSGLGLGELPPGGFRDIAWLVAPETDEPYRATVTVKSSGLHPVSALSVPTRRRYTPTVDNALPDPRRMVEAQTLADGLRSVRVVSEAPTLPLARGENAALSSGFEETTSYALPAPVAAPAGTVPSHTDFEPELAAAPLSANVIPALAAPKPPAEGATALPSVETAGATAPIHAVGGVAADQADHGAGEAVDVLAGIMEAPEQTPEAAAASRDRSQVEAAANAAVPPKPLVPEPLVIIGSLEASSTRVALRMARESIDSANLGWWRHVMFMRAMLPEQSPLAEHDDAWRTMRAALAQPLKTLYPRTFAPDFQITEAFVDALDENAAAALASLDALSGDRRFGIYFGTAEGGTRIDAILPVLLPTSFANEAFDAAWHTYHDAATRIFNYDSFLDLGPSARFEHHAKANAALDDYLMRVLDATP